mmetsp:Transcript_887/g.2310  ORF Transcript_887/g.2310 Transcript_887/m.2310 type:complete len:295 (+) Transcript_887:67-951(+)|eukprot:CAMPEP_0119122274 /NCGR_PEP_ID=MMETSP1310-20130426/2581_1 /TAXON_ID=464262 /ORGANISM="Genus nov. species nov., Strain RCC2339" /LENGTH=294 /DNA_ID=CAMNT_0007111907 /DNA_START=73 /DNA_END=957 /DNA_ORIENTATION=+
MAAKGGHSTNVQKAQELVYQAKQEENRFTIFSGNQKYEEAGSLYSKAGNQYKIAKQFKEAGDTYMLAAASFQKGKAMHDAATNWVNAAKVFRKVSAKDAVRALEHAVSYYSDQGRFSQAAKLQQEIGTVYENDGDFDRAVPAYQAAGELFEGENTMSSANKCFVKVADIYSEQEEYAKAVKLYEKMAENALDNNLLQWGCKEYYFKAGLCILATGDFGEAQRKVEEYCASDSRLPSSREGKLLIVLTKACLDNDLQSYTNALVEYDAVSPLDKWKTSILLKAKNILKERGDGIL